MRYLSEEEARSWSDKLPLSGLSDQFNTFNKNIFNSESAMKKQNYKFVFSIAKNKLEIFEGLLDKFLKDGFKIKITDGFMVKYQVFDEKILSELNSLQFREEHVFYNKEYIRFSYDFKNIPAILLISYCQILLDIINIIGNYYQFDANGEEICNIKYQLGSVVSLKNDKSDFIIESVEFLRKNTERYDDVIRKGRFDNEYVLYKLLKIEHNLNSQVLQFSGEPFITTSANIIPNRDSRISEILG